MSKFENYFPIAAFFAFLVKTMMLPPTFPDALILASLVGYVILNQLRLKDKTLAKYDEQLRLLEEKTEKNINDIKLNQTSISSMKLSSGLKSVGLGKVEKTKFEF